MKNHTRRKTPRASKHPKATAKAAGAKVGQNTHAASHEPHARTATTGLATWASGQRRRVKGLLGKLDHVAQTVKTWLRAVSRTQGPRSA